MVDASIPTARTLGVAANGLDAGSRRAAIRRTVTSGALDAVLLALHGGVFEDAANTLPGFALPGFAPELQGVHLIEEGAAPAPTATSCRGRRARGGELRPLHGRKIDLSVERPEGERHRLRGSRG